MAKIHGDAGALVAYAELVRDRTVDGNYTGAHEAARELLSRASKIFATLSAYQDLYDQAEAAAEVDRAVRRSKE